MKQQTGNLAKPHTSESKPRSSARQLLSVRHSWLASLMLAGPLFGQQMVLERAAEPTVLRVRVEYYNYAGVPKSVMKEGLSTAERIFAQAGVQVLWKEVRLDSMDDPKTSSNADRPSRLCLRILPRAMSNHAEQRFEAIGSAIATDDNTGLIANVFYQRLEGLRTSVVCSRGTMLGNVIAHELGHLLLGRNSHSESGIMSANWQERQIVRLRAGSLLFRLEEAERIRHNILERERRLQILSTIP